MSNLAASPWSRGPIDITAMKETLAFWHFEILPIIYILVNEYRLQISNRDNNMLGQSESRHWKRITDISKYHTRYLRHLELENYRK